MKMPRNTVVATCFALGASIGGFERAARADGVHTWSPDGYFSTEASNRLVAEFIRDDTKAHLEKSRDVVWVQTHHFSIGNGANYCIGAAGLTEAPLGNANVRRPARLFWGASRPKARGRLDDAAVRDCRSDAFRVAVEGFAKASLEDQLAEIEKTRGRTGKRALLEPSPTTVSLEAFGLSERTREQVMTEVPGDFRAQFDYRRVSWVVAARSFEFDGQVVCFADAGVAARPPDDKLAHWPSDYFSNFWEMPLDRKNEADAHDTCREEVAVKATRQALAAAWDDSALFAGFAKTREEGLPLPPIKKAPPKKKADAARDPDVPKLAAATPPSKNCSPPAGKVLRYSDRCTNGDCVRTFENGCSIRFQAPYCYDMLQQRWTWKPEGC